MQRKTSSEDAVHSCVPPSSGMCQSSPNNVGSTVKLRIASCAFAMVACLAAVHLVAAGEFAAVVAMVPLILAPAHFALRINGDWPTAERLDRTLVQVSHGHATTNAPAELHVEP